MPRYDSEGMILKPDKMIERVFRKMLARQTEVSVNGQEITLQSVSPQWYYNVNDQCGMTAEKGRDTARYMDLMFKNAVIAPNEISRKGIDYGVANGNATYNAKCGGAKDSQHTSTARRQISASAALIRARLPAGSKPTYEAKA